MSAAPWVLYACTVQMSAHDVDDRVRAAQRARLWTMTQEDLRDGCYWPSVKDIVGKGDADLME
jgi:hypothetical protein